LLPITHERGYLIPAIGDQYVACATILAKSIQDLHPDAHVTILTQDQLPFGELESGQANDWQCFWASPYRQTIKLEADMIAATAIDHWWTLFEKRDLVISQGARTYRDQPAQSRFYRKIFDANNLPDVYNAITYWKVCPQAQEFFGWVRDIFINWKEFKTLLKFPDDEPTTDVVYAMAAKIMGPELVTLPPGLGPTIVHMKRHVNGLIGEDWTQELIWENNPFRINTIAQWGFVHYHVKEWRP
jgi:hypothetical protein